MPRRFIHGAKQPNAYPLGLIGPEDMSPDYLPFIKKIIDNETYRLSNVEILVNGLKAKLSYKEWGGIEILGKLYAAKHWYTVKIYREIRKAYRLDDAFLKDAKGFIVFDDGSRLMKFQRELAQDTKKPVRIYKLRGL